MSHRLLAPEMPPPALVVAALRRWIEARVAPDALAWLDGELGVLQQAPSDRRLDVAVGRAARHVGREPLHPTGTELGEAAALRPGWDPRDWCADEAARVALLLATASIEPDALPRRLERLVRTADGREHVAFARGLPLYPDPPAHVARGTEAVRTNLKPVFEATAHRNPYPAEQFDEGAWNQMVLKALFVESPLDPIVGLDARVNPRLATMLVRYAGERRAASRPVSPELWRCVGPVADETALDALAVTLASDDARERAAAVLALRASDDHRAATMLAEAGDAGRTDLDWAALAPVS